MLDSNILVLIRLTCFQLKYSYFFCYRMQLKEKKSSMERDKRKLESELERQRQKIGKQVFLQVVQKKQQNDTSSSQQQLLAQNGLTVATVMDQQILADRSHLLLSNLSNSSPKSLSSMR